MDAMAEPKKEEKKEAEGEVTLKVPFKLSGRLLLWLLLLATGGTTGFTLLETLGLSTHVEEKAKLSEQVDAAAYKAMSDRVIDLMIRTKVLETQVQRLERAERRAGVAVGMAATSKPPHSDGDGVPEMPAPPAPELPSYEDIRSQVQRKR
jgi:nitrogen regulatory protein PII-like uncharacterized protein